MAREILGLPTAEHNMVRAQNFQYQLVLSDVQSPKTREGLMPQPPYRVLGILLRVFSLLATLGGLLMIFADKPLIVRILLRLTAFEGSRDQSLQ